MCFIKTDFFHSFSHIFQFLSKINQCYKGKLNDMCCTRYTYVQIKSQIKNKSYVILTLAE